MLIEKDYTGKIGAKFKCDRCGDILPNPRSKRYRLALTVSTPSRYSKQVRSYDLCKRCASFICLAIEKGVKENKKEGANDERSK